MTSRTVVAATAALLAWLLAACGAAAQTKAGAPLADAGKPVAAFGIEHELGGRPVLGVPLEVRVTLRPQTVVGDVTVELSADSGLQIDPRDAVLSAASASRDAPAEWVVTVLPLADGVLRLRLFAEGIVDGARQGRSVVVPIRVGSAKADGRSGDEANGRPGSEAVEPAEGAEPDASGREDQPLIRLPAVDPR
ncbi:MAG TPA: hypothetical protein VF329_07510 [Gammaproteobacteria bacterium]